MRDRFFRPDLVAAACALCAFAVRSEDVIYGPDGAPTVVQRKLHTMSGKWEAGVSFDVALNTALVDQLGGVLGVSYHPNEWLDLGVEALLHRTALSTLARNVRADLCSNPDPTRCRAATPHKGEFANDNQLRAGAFAVARFAPIYGKFNLASELPVHFQAFLLGGLGGAAVHRESINLCVDPGTGTCNSYQTSDALKVLGEVGGGFRFYLGQRLSVRTEVRGYLFPSSYKKDNDLTVPGSGAPHGYLAAIAIFDAGLSLLF